MILLCLFVLIITLYGIEYKADQDFFFSKCYTQSWKGILCILIMITHILEKYNWPNFLYNIHSFGYIEVAIFFLFSGYGLKYSYNINSDYIKNFVSRRFVKIYIPYLICSLVCYVLKVIIIGGENYWNIIELLKIIIGVNAIWFVKALIIFYVAFWIIYRFFPQKGNLFMGIFTLCYILICYINNMDKTWYGSVIPFWIGIFIADNINKIKSKHVEKKYIIVIAMISLVLEVLYQTFKENIFWGSLITRNMLCITIVIFFLLVTMWLKVDNKITQFIGTISYEFFLVHFTIIALVKVIFASYSLDVQAILVFILTLIVAIALNKINELILKKIVK